MGLIRKLGAKLASAAQVAKVQDAFRQAQTRPSYLSAWLVNPTTARAPDFASVAAQHQPVAEAKLPAAAKRAASAFTQAALLAEKAGPEARGYFEKAFRQASEVLSNTTPKEWQDWASKTYGVTFSDEQMQGLWPEVRRELDQQAARCREVSQTVLMRPDVNLTTLTEAFRREEERAASLHQATQAALSAA